MYKIHELTEDEFILYEKKGLNQTIFQTSMWIDFLKKNQSIEPVFLEVLKDNETVCALFVGGIIKKFGIRILGSPFEGWLTPDMGFICLESIDYNVAIRAISAYAFKKKKCLLLQIEDKKINTSDLDDSFEYTVDKLLRIDIDKAPEAILEGFKKNGRRDVRASGRKDVVFEGVPFDKKFVEEHYKQLIDVFAKQNLKPFYSVNKLYDLVEVFENYPERVLAVVAKTSEGKNIASIFSFGYQDWGYYMGAASYRSFQKLLPNEGLFWEFVKFWKMKEIKNLDLVGYREYKLKYNPDIVEKPVVLIGKYKCIITLKNIAKKCVELKREIKSRICK